MLTKEQIDKVVKASEAMRDAPTEEHYIDFINSVTPCVAIELANRHAQLARLLLLIDSDAWAASHQSLGQYRTALLNSLRNG